MDNIPDVNITSENKKPEFEEVYMEYYTLIYKYILKKINNLHIAEDLTSEIFYNAFKNYSKYNPERASIKTWLFTITDNRLKNYYRDEKITYNIDDNINKSDFIADDIMLEAAFLQECRDILSEGLKILPERNQKVIILKYFYNKTSEEIAAELNLTAGNVRILVMRTIQKLSNYFEYKGFKMEDYIE